MARRPSIFRRILQAIGLGERRKETPEPEAPEPPPFERQYPGGGGIFPPEGYENLNDLSEENRLTWDYITSGDGDINDWWDLYIETGITRIEQSSAEIDRLWGEFLRAFYLYGNESGSIRREEFYTDSGLTKRRVDWQAWREIKRT